MPKNTKDLHYLDLQIKEISADGTITGYGSTYDKTPDSYGDIIDRGAFKKSVGERKPKMLWQHNRNEPIGQWVEITNTRKGLKMVGSLNLNVQRGKEAYELYKRGDIDGLSIGYRVVNSEFNNKTGIRTIKEAKLFEVSLVTFPANENAQVTSVKQDLTEAFDELNIRQQQHVLNYIDFIKTQSLDEEEPESVDDEEQEDLSNVEVSEKTAALIASICAKSSSEGNDDDDDDHSTEEADNDSNESKQDEPDDSDEDEQLIHSLDKLTNIIRGSK